MWRTSRSREPSLRCERLEALKERHEKGLLTSVEFLKELLNLARDVVSADARRRERGDLHLGLLAQRRPTVSLWSTAALLHDSTAARVGALFQLLVQDTTAQDFGLPSSAIVVRSW